MKIPIACFTCAFENGDVTFDNLALSENPIYTYACPNGHESHFKVQAHKYELLFESGLNAFIDGYYREAVTSFHVALERFYEHVVASVLLQDGHYKSWEEFLVFLKDIKRSENMIGSYNTIVFQKIGKVLMFDARYPLAHRIDKFPDPIKFRNEIIHNGLLPTREQALQYASGVAQYIQEVIILFEGLNKKIFEKCYFEKYRFDSSNFKHEISIVGINLFQMQFGFRKSYVDLEKYIAEVIEQRKKSLFN